MKLKTEFKIISKTIKRILIQVVAKSDKAIYKNLPKMSNKSLIKFLNLCLNMIYKKIMKNFQITMKKALMTMIDNLKF